MNAVVTNEEALAALSKGNHYEAQELFRKNAHKNPSFMSLHNLGAFYVTEGMELYNSKVRSAKKLGLKYLQKAEMLSQSHINLAAIGDLYFEYGDFCHAEAYYKRAYNLNPSYEIANNLGAALYIQKKYTEAMMVFKNMPKSCPTDIKASVILLSAFCALYSGNREQASDIVSSLDEVEDPDVLALLYLSSNGELSEAAIDSVLSKFHVDASLLAMAVDYLIKVGRVNDANQYAKVQIDRLRDSAYNTTKEIATITELLKDKNERQALISAYQYIPPIIKICYFVGCTSH